MTRLGRRAYAAASKDAGRGHREHGPQAVPFAVRSEPGLGGYAARGLCHPGPGLGRRGQEATQAVVRACAAWLLLLGCGLVLGLTGQLDWTLFGRPVAGERFFFSAGLIVSAFGLFALGRRSEGEAVACVATLAAALGSLAAAPISYQHLSAGWWAYHAPVWLAHLGLTAQLAMWWRRSGPEKRGIGIMAIGVAVEALLVYPLVQLHGIPASCAAGMALTCISGPYAAVALPAVVTLALCWAWLDPVADFLRGLGRGHGGR